MMKYNIFTGIENLNLGIYYVITTLNASVIDTHKINIIFLTPMLCFYRPCEEHAAIIENFRSTYRKKITNKCLFKLRTLDITMSTCIS